MTPRRSHALALALITAIALGACRDEEPEPAAASPSPTEIEETSPSEEFVILPESGKLPISNSCIDIDGDYRGSLPDGGLLLLRGMDGDRVSVQLLPSADADLLATDPADDLGITTEGDYVVGEPTVYTEDGSNSLTFEFAALWGVDTPACEEGDAGSVDPETLYNSAFVDDEEFVLDNMCQIQEPGFLDYYAAMESLEDGMFITIHLELAETNEGGGEYVELTESGLGGVVDDLDLDGTVYRGTAFISNEGDAEGSVLAFALDTEGVPTCD